MFLELRECKARSNSVSEGSKYLLTPTSYKLKNRKCSNPSHFTALPVFFFSFYSFCHLAYLGCPAMFRPLLYSPCKHQSPPLLDLPVTGRQH